jgi:hypothetical protein
MNHPLRLKHLAWLCAALLAVGSVALPRERPKQAAEQPDKLPYPQGDQFPLGLFSFGVENPEVVPEIRKFGWNLGHSYGSQEDLLKSVRRGDLFAFVRVGNIQPANDANSEASAQRALKRFAADKRVAWWSLPEERRYWIPDEFSLIKHWSRWTRRYDPRPRPTFMYLPGHYTAADIAPYVPYLDIIGAGAYTEYMFMPRAWVRYRVESEIEAIHKAGFKVGPNYLRGEKTPIGIPMLFSAESSASDGKKFAPITPEAAYHDFYSSLAAGARGILVFSYYHRHDRPGLEKSFAAYCRAASEVSGSEGLGQALLFGQETEVSFAVTKGPSHTRAFRPPQLKQDIRYPALNVRAVKWKDHLYILAVNSTEDEEGLRVTFKGLPAKAKDARVLFERRTVPLIDGQIEDRFKRLGVHIYKAPL